MTTIQMGLCKEYKMMDLKAYLKEKGHHESNQFVLVLTSSWKAEMRDWEGIKDVIEIALDHPTHAGIEAHILQI